MFASTKQGGYTAVAHSFSIETVIHFLRNPYYICQFSGLVTDVSRQIHVLIIFQYHG